MAELAPDVVIRRTRGENATYIIDQVQELGLNPDPSSRLMQMHRVLNSGYIRFDDPRFSTALEAVRDLQQLGFVFVQLRSRRDHQFTCLVKRALKDSVLPQDNQQQSAGRDSQFHLYLAAVCQNAGLQPVEFEEPDVSCVIDGEKFVIAAKRIKNLDRLHHRIRDGADQISRSERPGIIAIEVSLAQNRENLPIVSRLQSQIYVTHATLRATQLLDRYSERIYRWVNDQGVLAVLLFDFRVRLRSDNQWGLDGMSTWFETTQGDPQAKREYDLFYNHFLTGVPNLTNLDEDSNW